MEIVRYSVDKQDEWDAFVRSSKNGTFLLERGYMDYHSSRFEDHSLLFYHNHTLLAVMPANIAGQTFYSHQGLTYGGLVLSMQATALQTLEMFDRLVEYVTSLRLDKIVYRAIPFIYHAYPSEEDLYALFRHHAVIVERKLSSAIYQDYAPTFQKLRKRKIRRAIRDDLAIRETDDIHPFWHILAVLLREKYNTTPVHTAAEMQALMARFPSVIRFYGVYDDDCLVAGVIMYETPEVAHAQYIAANEGGKKKGALDFLFDYLINIRYRQKRYLDFGVSVENGGWFLNEGLAFQKEGFGGRAIVYDTYEIALTKDKTHSL